MKKQILTLALLVFLLSFTYVSAQEEIGIYETDEDIDLQVTCVTTGGFCSVLATCTISVTQVSPVSLTVVSGALMQNQIDFHNLTLNTSFNLANGEYQVKGVCVDGADEEPINFFFLINPLGDVLDTSESIVYFMVIFLSVGLFLIFFTVAIKLPFQNAITIDKMFVERVEWLKYFKMFFIWLSYGTFLWFLNLLTALVNNYIVFEGATRLISNLYVFLYAVGFGLTTAILWLIFLNLWRDIILNKEILSKGKAFINPKT